MDKMTGVKRLRVRGLSAVGYCARLKAIGVNLFRAARVKRALDALNITPEILAASVCFTILAVKERFLSPWHRLINIFKSAIENAGYAFKIAA
jgi:hypothetical protein